MRAKIMQRLPIKTLLVLGLICAIGFGSGIFQDLIATYKFKTEALRDASEEEAIQKNLSVAATQTIVEMTPEQAQRLLTGEDPSPLARPDFEKSIEEVMTSESVTKYPQKQQECLRQVLIEVSDDGFQSEDFLTPLSERMETMDSCGWTRKQFGILARYLHDWESALWGEP